MGITSVSEVEWGWKLTVVLSLFSTFICNYYYFDRTSNSLFMIKNFLTQSGWTTWKSSLKNVSKRGKSRWSRFDQEWNSRIDFIIILKFRAGLEKFGYFQRGDRDCGVRISEWCQAKSVEGEQTLVRLGRTVGHENFFPAGNIIPGIYLEFFFTFHAKNSIGSRKKN